jgi:hypothetical protein
VSPVKTNKQSPYVNEPIVEEAAAKIKPSSNESSGRYAKTYREINTAPLSIKDGCPIHFESIPGIVRDAGGLGSSLVLAVIERNIECL